MWIFCAHDRHIRWFEFENCADLSHGKGAARTNEVFAARWKRSTQPSAFLPREPFQRRSVKGINWVCDLLDYKGRRLCLARPKGMWYSDLARHRLPVGYLGFSEPVGFAVEGLIAAHLRWINSTVTVRAEDEDTLRSG